MAGKKPVKSIGRKKKAVKQPARSAALRQGGLAATLQESELRYQRLYHETPVLLHSIDRHGRLVEVNDYWLKTMGYGREEVIGRPVTDFFTDASKRYALEVVQPAFFRDGVVKDIAYQFVKKSGELIDVVLSATAERDAAGTVIRSQAVIEDRTRYTRAEAALRESEVRFRALVEQAGDGFELLNEEGRIVDANTASCRQLGYTRDELLGMRIFDIDPSIDLAGFSATFNSLVSTQPVSFQTLHRRKDGTTFPVEVTTSLILLTGGVRHALALVRDITERRQAEEAQRVSDEKYRSLFDNSEIAMFRTRLDGSEVLEVNQKWLELVGKTREESLGRPSSIVWEDPREREKMVNMLLADGSVSEFEFTMRNEQKGVRHCVTSLRLYREQGILEGTIADITERKRAENALRESEERFKAITTTASDAILLMDDRGMIVYWNPAAERIFGYSAAEAQGQDLHKFLAPTRLQGDYQKGFARFVATGQGPVIDRSLEMAAIKKDGTEFPIEISTSAMKLGDRWHALGIVRDITERKRTGQEMREKEGKYRLLFEAANDGIFIHGATGFIDCNQRGAEMYGLPKEQLIGRSPVEFAPERQPDGRLSADVAGEKVRAALNGVPQVFQWQPMRADGSLFDVEITLSRLELGGEVCLQAIVRDNTERKRAVDALQASEVRFRSLIEHAAEGIVAADVETRRIRYANPEICRMLGYHEQELLRLTAPDLVIPDERQESTRTFQSHVNGTLHTTERTFRKKDGSPLRVSVNSVQMDFDGHPCLVGFFSEITGRLLLEEERIKMQKLESIGTLAGGIAHDFNNLLQGIFGYISMAKLTHDQKEKSLAMLGQAEQALHQAVNLTSQLLTFSKGGKPRKKVIALRPVIENAVKFALSGSRVISDVRVAEDLCAVEADEGQIGQVIQNIVLNADQAMPLGGTLTITAVNVPAAGLPSPATDAAGKYVALSVQDRGTGIPPEHVSRIFDPYFTTKDKGSGLGLATSYSIARNHGGLLTVSSELGKGATFTLYLPASSAQPAPAGPSPVPTAPQRKGRILIMDDEPVVREVSGELMRELGHEVDFAAHGAAAIEKYQQALAEGKPFDIVILDLTIRGGMGGLETMRNLLAIDPAVKAVVSSGYSDDAAAAEYRKHGFTQFLEKPYKMEDLCNVLNELLQ